MSALRKANGGVRGIVVGDVLRRLVARTIAQQVGAAVERATAPFQYALKTRRCWIWTHGQPFCQWMGSGHLTSSPETPRWQVWPVWRKGTSCCRSSGFFHSSPTTFLWEDDAGTTHHIRQGEG